MNTSVNSILRPCLISKLLLPGSCLAAAFLGPFAYGGDYLFDNQAASTYPTDWNVAANWNPNTLPGGPLDNVVFANVGGGMNTNPAALTNFLINNVASATINQIRFTSAPANATAFNMQAASAQTLTLNQIIVSGNVPNPPTVGGTAANNGPWQIQPNVSLTAAVDANYNPTGKLRVVHTAGSTLQLQGQITTGAGGFVKDGTGPMRFGTSGATFTNSIGGDILINSGTLQASNAGSGNVLGGTGRILLNGPGTVLTLNSDYATSYGRDVVINANATIGTDRSGTTAISMVQSLGTITVGANDKYLTLNSANSYGYSFAGVNLGANTLNMRNGLNNTANTDATGHAAMGVITGSGTINMSGSGGNSVVGLTFNAASPGFSGKVNLFEGGSHIVTATGAFGSANVTLGEQSTVLPITYPNIAVGSSGSPIVLSNPWSALLKYNTNNPTSGSIIVNGLSQVNMGVVPNGTDKITLNRYGIIQGSSAELAAFDTATNLTLPAADAIIAHEVLGGSDPANLPATASHYFGTAANLNGAITVGAGTMWKGVSNDRQSRTIGGGATTLTVNGGDSNPATAEVSLCGMNSNSLTLLNTAGDTFASTTGQKFTIAIEGYGNGFNGLGSGASPGGTVIIGRAASLNGLQSNVDAINVNSGNVQFNAAGGLGGVPLSINNSAGLDIAGVIGNALDGVINVNSGGTIVLNDAIMMTAAPVNTITINSGGKLHLTGSAPANILASTQPILFSGTGHTVRLGVSNMLAASGLAGSGIDTTVPDTGAIWEIAATSAVAGAANTWGTNLTPAAGQTMQQTFGLTTDGGVITNDNGGTRFLDAKITLGATAPSIVAASTGTSLVITDTTGGTGVISGSGTTPIQINSTTPINGITKTHNPTAAQNNDAVYENTHNASPQVIFTTGLKSGTVTLASGSLILDGPDANTVITGDINMGDGTRLYLADGGSVNIGNGFGGAAPRRGDLTPLIIAGTLTTGTINVGNNSRIEMGLDQTDPALISSLVGGRAQVSQKFAVAAGADLMDTDRRNFWVNRSAGSTALTVDLNNITLGANANLSIQEANTDVRASITMSGDATVSGFAAGAGCFDLKNVGGTGTLKIGRPDMPFSAVGLYGSINPNVAVSNVYGRFEVRDGATVPAGFVFTDNAANALAIQSDQNATPTGINTGTDHTLSIWQGQTGAGGTNLTAGTFNMNAANNAAGLYVDDAATGASIVNDIQTGITLGASGTVVFSARSNTDAAVNGIARIKDVNVNAGHAMLATRDLTDLEVTNLNVSTNAVVKVDGARTDGRGAVRIGSVAAGANDVHFQDGRTTINGNVTAGKLTVGGTSLEISPAGAGTSTIAASAVQVNTMLAAKGGTVDFGSTVLTSSPVGTKIGGLREGVIVGNGNDMTGANPGSTAATANLYDTANTGIRLDPRAGQNNYADDNATVTNDTARGWSRNQTWVYSGEIYDADGVFTMAEQIDDNTQIIIDGVTVLSSNGLLVGGTGLGFQAPFEVWRTTTNTATKDGLTSGYTQPITGLGDIGMGMANTVGANINPSGGITNFGMGANSDGWHTVEIRVGNGAGGAASNVANAWGNYFGLGLNKDGGTSLLGSDYSKAIDDGNKSLFRAATVAKGNVDVDNGATLSAGSVQTIGLLTFGRNGAAGASTVNLSAATTGDVDKVEIAAAATASSALNVLNVAGKLVAGQLNVPGGKTLEINSGGNGELEVTQGSSLAGNTTASILLEGGTLRLSNPSGSALGHAALTLDSGTLRGNGSTTGSVLATGGTVIAPGASVGTLGFGSLNLDTGSTYEVEVTGAATNDKVNVTGGFTANGIIKVTLSGYAPVAGNAFDIADGTITGAPTFDFTSAVLTAGLGWDTTQFATDGTIRIISLDPYIAWAAGFGLIEGKTGDDDKDGDSNLLEFATNANPTAGGSGARAFGKVVPLSGDNVLTLTVAVRKNAAFAASGANQAATKDNVVYTVEATDDLTTWTTVVVTKLDPSDSAAVQAALAPLPTLGADWEWHTFRTDDTLAIDNRDLIRLRVAAQ